MYGRVNQQDESETRATIRRSRIERTATLVITLIRNAFMTVSSSVYTHLGTCTRVSVIEPIVDLQLSILVNSLWR